MKKLTSLSPMTKAILVGAVLAGLAAGTLTFRPRKQAESKPEKVDTREPIGETIARHGLASPAAGLLTLLDQSIEKDDLVVLIPSASTNELAKAIEDRKLKVKVLEERENYQYYVNQIIPALRRQKNDQIWLGFDQRDKGLTEALHVYFLKDHRLDVNTTFGDYALFKIYNAPPAGQQQLIQLDLVSAQRNGSMTEVQIDPTGKIMFLGYKHGEIIWKEIGGERSGVALQLPELTKEKSGVFVQGESGLIGITPHPREPKLYVHYCYQELNGPREAIVSEYPVDYTNFPQAIVLGEPRVILRIPQGHEIHNAGQLAFGPDGFLYIAVGDGAVAFSSQNLRGKILRIDPDHPSENKPYSIPAGNPFPRNDALPPECWAWGFRNPWRFCFAPDGRLIAGDVGEAVNEEITFVLPGRHHGWPSFEGSSVRGAWTLPEVTPVPPLLSYGRQAGMSVTGGYVYEGAKIPWLRGKYVFADYLSGKVWALDLPEKGKDTATLDISAAIELGRWPMLITTFGRHPSGELYVGERTGEVYQLAPSDGLSSPPVVRTVSVLDDEMARNLFKEESVPHERTGVTPAQIELGDRLYHDRRLSGDGTISCATCHPLERLGQDGSIHGRRNTLPSVDAFRQFAQGWDYRVETVEEISLAMLREEHLLKDNVAAKLAALSSDYDAAFRSAFPDDPDPLREANAGSALGAYLRQLKSRSRWDGYLDGDDGALSTAEKEGLSLFVSTGCIACHQGRKLGGGMPQKLGIMSPWAGEDKGRFEITKLPADSYFFRVSPLLNVAETAPYYHDGSMKTLEAAIRNMAEIQLNRQLSDDQVKAVITFFGALNGKLQ